MKDLLPEQSTAWQYVEKQFRTLLSCYGYLEIRTPLLEYTSLFKRSIGEATDLVEKEMYTFNDRNGESVTMRPENTTAVVRAALEHSLLHNHNTQRLWYIGPMFRYERPQKGRYRQFHQLGVETFNISGPDIDAEVILLSARLWKMLGLIDNVTLELNSLGSFEARSIYCKKLIAYLELHAELLDEDSQRKLASNPLRILDSKNPSMADLLDGAPRLLDHLDSSSEAHFERLKELLNNVGTNYLINPRLVRGLDYYTSTVFEWTTKELGSKVTVCAGGRYDGLVSSLGGKPTPAVGFAIGEERLILLLQKLDLIPSDAQNVDVYLIALGTEAERQAIVLAERMRDTLPLLRLQLHCGGGSFKSKIKRADKSGARITLILGEEECKTACVKLKYMRELKKQYTITQASLAKKLGELFKN